MIMLRVYKEELSEYSEEMRSFVTSIRCGTS